MRKTLRGVLWAARGTATLVGLAVMIAVVLGVGTAALAAVPGDPFRLGQTNTISNAFTKIAGFNGGDAILKVDNDSSAGGSRALDLRVEPGKQPINVNAEAGKATNLDADEVDGLGAEEIGVNGLERVNDLSDMDSESPKTVFAQCPDGKVVVGTAHEFLGGTSGAIPDQQTDVAVRDVIALDHQVTVRASEVDPTTVNWSVRAVAICAEEGTP